MKVGEIDVVKNSKLVEKQALKAGRYFLNGKRFEEFDVKLLKPESDNFSEHIDCQASGQLYYNMMVEYARRKLEAAKNTYDDWFAEKYGEARRMLEGEMQGKPNIGDVEKKVKSRFPKGYSKKMGLVRDLQSAHNTLQIWANAWGQKSFSLGQLNENKIMRLKGGEEALKKIDGEGLVKKRYKK